MSIMVLMFIFCGAVLVFGVWCRLRASPPHHSTKNASNKE
jgi:hypothetical protein